MLKNSLPFDQEFLDHSPPLVLRRIIERDEVAAAMDIVSFVADGRHLVRVVAFHLALCHPLRPAVWL